VGAAVAATLSSGFYVLGSRVEAFEREFASYGDAQHAVGVGSGTDALHLALRACGVRPGDRVITAPNTAVPTICAIAQAGAFPVFVDIEPGTLNLDPEKLAAYLAVQLAPVCGRAIVPVHL
jgi:dTDP-4-amino-4,6-dideoxygalactose transaminase